MSESLVLKHHPKSHPSYTLTSSACENVFDQLNRFGLGVTHVSVKFSQNELPKVEVCFEVIGEVDVISSLEGMSVSVTPTKREKHDEI